MVSRLASRPLVVLVLLAASLGPARLARAAQAEPEITAKSAIVVDASDRMVLYEKDPHERRPPASTTKILTGLIVIERLNPKAMVTISRNAEEVGQGEEGPNPPAQLNLVAGERVSVHDLLYGLMLESANDAAVALAERVAGSVKRFADLMNDRVAEIGAKDSHFVNPHGLDEPDHYSSAFDLMLLASEAMKNSVFRDVVGTKSFEFPGFGARPPHLIQNRNKLLDSYEGADGVKTGFTTPAGHAIVASAHRSGEQRIAVVLGSPSDAQADAVTLMDYGFDSFTRLEILRGGKPWGHATLGNGETFVVIPSEELIFLVRSDSKPKTVLDVNARTLTITALPHPSRTVPISLQCARRNQCHSTVTKHENLVTRAWHYLAPVARLLSVATRG